MISSELLAKISTPIGAALSLIPDSLLSFTGKILTAIVLAAITWGTHTFCSVLYDKYRKPKRMKYRRKRKLKH